MLNNSFIYSELIKNIYVKKDLLTCINIIEEEPIKNIKNIKNNKNNKTELFIDFIKKNSSLPDKFLDEYFELINYKIDDISDEKIVDLDNVIKWLDISKHKAKETLIKSYWKNIDFIIKKVVKPKGKGGQNAEKILLTIRCFKKFCQSTRSKHGNNIREYFLDIEYILNKYKNYIIEGLADKIDRCS